MYTVRYEKKAKKHLQLVIPKKCSAQISKIISEKILADPILYGIPLKGLWKGHYKIRVGNYRIIYKVLQDDQIVNVVAIDHRRQVYKKFFFV